MRADFFIEINIYFFHLLLRSNGMIFMVGGESTLLSFANLSASAFYFLRVLLRSNGLLFVVGGQSTLSSFANLAAAASHFLISANDFLASISSLLLQALPFLLRNQRIPAVTSAGTCLITFSTFFFFFPSTSSMSVLTSSYS